MATKKKSGAGGPRPNAGRKPHPTEKKKQPVWLYVEMEVIESHGGAERIKEIAYEAIKAARPKRKVAVK